MKNIIFGNRYLNMFVMATVFMTLSLLINVDRTYGLDNLGLNSGENVLLDGKLDINADLKLKGETDDELQIELGKVLVHNAQLDMNRLGAKLRLNLNEKLVDNNRLNLKLNLDADLDTDVNILQDDKASLDLHDLQKDVLIDLATARVDNISGAEIV